jgi:hypothetical protein
MYDSIPLLVFVTDDESTSCDLGTLVLRVLSSGTNPISNLEMNKTTGWIVGGTTAAVGIGLIAFLLLRDENGVHVKKRKGKKIKAPNQSSDDARIGILTPMSV